MRLTSRPVRSTLPVNLITDGRVALVVGGGRVGLRKVKSLLAANLSVVLISPTALPDFLQLGTPPENPVTPPNNSPSNSEAVPNFPGAVPNSPTPIMGTALDNPPSNSEAVPNFPGVVPNSLTPIMGTAPDNPPSFSGAVPKNLVQNPVPTPQTSGTALDNPSSFSGAVPNFPGAVPKNLVQNPVPNPQTSGTALEKSGAVPKYAGAVPTFRWIEKAYDGEALEGGWLAIFACTDDKIVNLRILEDARKAKIPCCLADGNWAEGDFTMPAILRTADIVFSVSTNGQDCRTSREMRDSISQWLKSKEVGRSVAVIGLSGAGLKDIHMSEGHKRKLCAILPQFKNIEGWFILNTCSRVELVVSGEISDSLIAALKCLLESILGYDKLCDIVSYVGHEAFKHLALVVSGLESPFLGEYAIAGQFKDALEESEREGGVTPFLTQFTSNVQQCAKEIRSQTSNFFENSAEIHDIAIDFIENSSFPIHSSKIAVLGTGSVGTSIAKLLSSKNIGFSWIYHKNPPDTSLWDRIKDGTTTTPATDTPSRRIDIRPWDSLQSTLSESDIIISALSLDQPIIWGQPIKTLPFNEAQPIKPCSPDWGHASNNQGLSPNKQGLSPNDTPNICGHQTPVSRGQPLKKLIIDLGQPSNFQFPDDLSMDIFRNIEIVTLGHLKDINRRKRQDKVVDNVRSIAFAIISKFLF